MEAQATIYCNFHFLNYPMDTQNCEFVMDGSYPYPDIVEFSLELGVFGVTNKHANTDEFEIDIKFNEKGNQTGINSVITLDRNILPYVIKYYLPCIAIIIVSLISFLISLSSIPARVALLVTQFLTLTNVLIAQQVNIKIILRKLSIAKYLQVDCKSIFDIFVYFREKARPQESLPRWGYI